MAESYLLLSAMFLQAISSFYISFFIFLLTFNKSIDSNDISSTNASIVCLKLVILIEYLWTTAGSKTISSFEAAALFVFNCPFQYTNMNKLIALHFYSPSIRYEYLLINISKLKLISSLFESAKCLSSKKRQPNQYKHSILSRIIILN